MEDKYNERHYKNYIVAVKSKIKSIEEDMKDLDEWKRIVNMTYEEWVEWMKER